MGNKVIRLLSSDQEAADHPITEADRGTIAILTASQRVDEQVASLEQEIQTWVALTSNYRLIRLFLSLLIFLAREVFKKARGRQ